LSVTMVAVFTVVAVVSMIVVVRLAAVVSDVAVVRVRLSLTVVPVVSVMVSVVKPLSDRSWAAAKGSSARINSFTHARLMAPTTGLELEGKTGLSKMASNNLC